MIYIYSELIAASQQQAALSMLHDVLSSKRARITTLDLLEPIAMKFLELAVELGKGKTAREGLHQYRNIVQNSTFGTLELVIKRFLELAQEKLAASQSEDGKAIISQADDLEALDSPETLMLRVLNTDSTKGKTEKESVNPWLRFLWEAFRTSLDTMRNNSKLEGLYQTVAEQAFAFCLKFDRKIEFRRLCELLRQHLSSSARYAAQNFAIDLNEPETLQRHLDTRFVQLNAAAKLEHWQEGFRSVEDIFNLIELSQKMPKPYMMATYYKTLSKIFLVGNNPLFHSAAFNEFFKITRTHKPLGPEDFSQMATKSLLSALASPITRGSLEIDEHKQKFHRLTTLLRATQIPTRDSLLKEALSDEIFSKVSAQAKDLYDILEVQFDPLSICEKVAPIFKALLKDDRFKDYVKPLHQVVLTRLLQQLSSVYSVIKLDTIVKLAALIPDNKHTIHTLEQFIVMGCKKGDFNQIRINHADSTLRFITDVSGSLLPETKGISANGLAMDHLKFQLGRFADRLSTLSPLMGSKAAVEQLKLRKIAFQQAKDAVEEERKEKKFRCALIAKKKQLLETELAEKEKNRVAQAAKDAIVEKQRLEADSKKRELERVAQHRLDIEKGEALKLAEKLTSELLEKNIKVDLKDLANLDSAKLRELQQAQVDKEGRELSSKVRQVCKRIDHVERAFRKEERPLLLEDYETQKKVDMEQYTLKCAAQQDAARLKFDRDMAMKARVLKMMKPFLAYKKKLDKQQDEEYAAVEAAARAEFEASKEQRIKELEREKIAYEIAEKKRVAEAMARAAAQEAEEKARAAALAKEQEATKSRDEARAAEREIERAKDAEHKAYFYLNLESKMRYLPSNKSAPELPRKKLHESLQDLLQVQPRLLGDLAAGWLQVLHVAFPLRLQELTRHVDQVRHRFHPKLGLKAQLRHHTLPKYQKNQGLNPINLHEELGQHTNHVDPARHSHQGHQQPLHRPLALRGLQSQVRGDPGRQQAIQYLEVLPKQANLAGKRNLRILNLLNKHAFAQTRYIINSSCVCG